MDDGKNAGTEGVKAPEEQGVSRSDEKPKKADETSEKAGDTDSDALSEWEGTFEGKTPQEVARELEDWKKHARQWEKRAKQNKPDEANSAAGEELARVTAERDANAVEVNMFRDLIGLRFERDTPVAFADLADSIAFREAYGKLDRSADDFADRLGELVDARAPKARTTTHVEVDGAANRGVDLYERLFKNS